MIKKIFLSILFGNKKNLKVILILVFLIIGTVLISKKIFFTEDKKIEETNSTINVPEDEIIQFNVTTETLIEYTYKLINDIRKKNNLSELEMGSLESTQLHASEMINHRFLSYWNLDGEKPYIRYSKTGGNGFISESIAKANFSESTNPKTAIDDIFQEMLNDGSEWNRFNKENIFNPIFNKISIGIAFNTTSLYLVLDFEVDTFDEFKINRDGNKFYFTVICEKRSWIPSKIDVMFDNLPSLTSKKDLRNIPFTKIYDSGTYVCTILPPYSEVIDVFPIKAEKWVSTQYSFESIFDLSRIFEEHGEGIYTFYIVESNKIWSSKSFWHKE